MRFLFNSVAEFSRISSEHSASNSPSLHTTIGPNDKQSIAFVDKAFLHTEKVYLMHLDEFFADPFLPVRSLCVILLRVVVFVGRFKEGLQEIERSFLFAYLLIV
jgi:hypothetical protein